jgi:uncharacterized HAD superfamily protein
LTSDNGKRSSVTFEDYLLTEYENIAEAHFKTIEAISSFFRYYLIIMGVPFALYSAIIGLSPQMSQFIYPLTILAGVVSLAISIVGFLVIIYIMNLRMDVILYARTVNGIRKHFYDKADLDISSKLNLRTLPQTPSLPAYFERLFFLPVVISFAVFNTLYLLLGTTVLSSSLPEIFEIASSGSFTRLLSVIPVWIGFVAVFFFFLHPIFYFGVARYRELTYLRSYSVGIDIDGVLSEHKEHFCNLLYQLTNKKLHPECILRIPVHEDPRHGVTEEDEKTVFNNLNYWLEMPCSKSAPLSIKKLRNGLKLKIYVFTYRPWPSEKIRQNSVAWKEWEDAALQVYKESNFAFPRLLYKLKRQNTLHNLAERTINKFLLIRMRNENLWKIGTRPIDIITKWWLQKKEIEYDYITIERGSEDVSDPQGHFRNRFYISRKKKIRFFVEDDHEKARKLSYICDVVFLMAQPYNESETVPSNVIRVESWDEIYRQIRKYS